nr:YihY/virulence factor BrkB family protein [Lusitaniella coriacea]
MERRLGGLSAEMAYNAMLALFPAILALVTAIGLFEDSLQATLLEFVSQFAVEDDSLQLTFRDLAVQVRAIAPDMAWQLLKNVVSEITETKSTSLFSLSFVAAIWISSSAVSAAMNALDQMQHIASKKRRPFWKAKSIAILLTLGSIVLMVIASFLVLLGDLMVKGLVALIVAIPELLQNTPGIEAAPMQEIRAWSSQAELLLDLWRLLSWPIALSIVSVAFAFIYRFGPSRRVRGTPIIPGAILAAISWAAISGLFRLYVNNFGNYNKVYGAVGAVIVLMLWLYMGSFVLLLGAQLNTTIGEEMRKRPLKQFYGSAFAENSAIDPKQERLADNQDIKKQ